MQAQIEADNNINNMNINEYCEYEHGAYSYTIYTT